MEECEDEGQIGGAPEGKLEDGEAQEVIVAVGCTLAPAAVEGRRQRHKREDEQQVQQEHNKDPNPRPTKAMMNRASPDNLHVALHHSLRQQLLGLDLDSMLEGLAAVVAAEQLLNIRIFRNLPKLVALDARGGHELQPCEEDLVIVC
eukprot:scaffold56168_cov73-Phaeocystis_antarctica.AAC.5